jgi:hypothetical protein
MPFDAISSLPTSIEHHFDRCHSSVRTRSVRLPLRRRMPQAATGSAVARAVHAPGAPWRIPAAGVSACQWRPIRGERILSIWARRAHKLTKFKKYEKIYICFFHPTLSVYKRQHF